MNKFTTWKKLVPLGVLAAGLLFLGSYFAVRGATNHGGGAALFGGEQPGTGGRIVTDEHWDVLPEGPYKRNCYAAAGMFLVIGSLVSWEVFKKWKRGDAVEE